MRLAEVRRRIAGLDVARRGTDARAVVDLLAPLGAADINDGELLARFHDQLLFLCAYPQSAAVRRRAESLLKRFSRRVSQLDDPNALLDPEVSGIAGTSVDLIFTYDFVRWLIDRVPGALAVDWDDDGPDRERLAAVLLPVLPLFEEEASVDANVPAEAWLRNAGGMAADEGLTWLLRALDHYPPEVRATLYDSLRIWVIWTLGESKFTRTLMRRTPETIFYQRTPLLARRDVSLQAALAGPPLSIKRLAEAEGAEVLDMARAALATRYRELYAFTYGDPATVMVADCGRGLEIVLVGITPERRLPLRAGFGPLLLRNGVPIGYADAYVLCDRIEVSFNIFYAFRDGESAYCFVQLLKLYQQLFGSTVFSIDPYQIGEGNEEAIDAGAFWFYRKLGFRSTDPAVERIAHREESRMATDPGHRTPARTLRRMAHSPLLHDVASASGELSGWDTFRIRNIGLASARAFAASGQTAEAFRVACAVRVAKALSMDIGSFTRRQRNALDGLAPALALIPDLNEWSDEEREGVAAIVKAKVARREERYVDLLMRHTRLREALVKLGS